MTKEQLRRIQILSHVTTIPGTFDRRFIRTLSRYGEDATLSDKQNVWLDNLWYKYRRQTGEDPPKPINYPASHQELDARSVEAEKLERWIHNATPVDTDHHKPVQTD